MTGSPGNRNKRLSIIKAAAKVFSRHGYHRARVEDIASEAGVGKGTVYEYFASKRHLFEEVVKEGLNFYTGRGKAHLSGEETARQKSGPSDLSGQLCALFEMHLTFLREYRDISRVALSDHALSSEEMHRWFCDVRRQKIERLKKLLAAGRDRGETGPDLDVELAAEFLWGILGSLWYKAVWEETELDIKDTAQKAVRLFMEGAGRR